MIRERGGSARGPARRRGRLRAILRHPLAFALRVWRGARRNQVLLLSGALAYNALLTIVPFFAVILLALVHLVDEAALMEVLGQNLDLLLPGQSDMILAQVDAIVDSRQLLSWVVIVLLVVFSSAAFLVLEGALSRIFEHRGLLRRRSLLVSAVIPYLYMLIVGVGLMALTLVMSGLHALGEHVHNTPFAFLGDDTFDTALVAVVGYLLLVALFTSFYFVLPLGYLRLRQALVGGVFAATLWEMVGAALGWYFAQISAVSLVYGSVATVIVVLLLLEVGALILLLGAQVIAEYERFVYREAYERAHAAGGRGGERQDPPSAKGGNPREPVE